MGFSFLCSFLFICEPHLLCQENSCVAIVCVSLLPVLNILVLVYFGSHPTACVM